MNNDIVMNNTAETTPSSVAVKVIRGDEMRRFNFNGQSFQELKKAIAEMYAIPEDDFILQYEDDEKDRVTLSTDVELKEAIQLHKYVLRFFVVGKPVAGEINAPLSPFPHPPHHHHHRRQHPHHSHGDDHQVVPATEGEAIAHPQGRRGHGHCPYPYARFFAPSSGHGHGPHRNHGHHGHHKRRHDKDDKEAAKAVKAEIKRWKKYYKGESSPEEKAQKKEIKQLMKATKQSIKSNWALVKEANPAQWPENRKLMIAEIKMAKRIIREQANTPVAAAVVTEQTTSVVVPAVEMQA